jgi:hypothetical protein
MSNNNRRPQASKRNRDEAYHKAYDLWAAEQAYQQMLEEWEQDLLYTEH